MGHKSRDSGGKYALLMLLCRHIGLFFGKRLLLHRVRKYSDSSVHTLWDSLRITFFTLESGFENIQIRCRIHRMCVDGAVGRNKKLILRIQKYPDACAQGLKKPLRPRQRERQQTKGLLSKTKLCTFVFSLCTFLRLPLLNKNVKWPCPPSSEERERRRLIFHISIWNLTLSLHI